MIAAIGDLGRPAVGAAAQRPGFEMGEIDLRIASLEGSAEREDDPADLLPDLPMTPPVTQIGDIARLNTTTPSSARGHTKRPRSSRLAYRHSPSPSHHSSLTRSPRRPRRQNTCPENGSCPCLCRQAVEPLAYVSGTGRQPYPGARRKRVHRNSSITCRSVSELTSPRRRTRAPQPNTISMTPSRSARRGQSPSAAIDWHHCAAFHRRLGQ